MNERIDLRSFVAEALGTFALVAIGPGAAMVAARTNAFGHSGVALAFGLAVTLVIAATRTFGGRTHQSSGYAGILVSASIPWARCRSVHPCAVRR